MNIVFWMKRKKSYHRTRYNSKAFIRAARIIETQRFVGYSSWNKSFSFSQLISHNLPEFEMEPEVKKPFLIGECCWFIGRAWMCGELFWMKGDFPNYILSLRDDIIDLGHFWFIYFVKFRCCWRHCLRKKHSLQANHREVRAGGDQWPTTSGKFYSEFALVRFPVHCLILERLILHKSIKRFLQP